MERLVRMLSILCGFDTHADVLRAAVRIQSVERGRQLRADLEYKMAANRLTRAVSALVHRRRLKAAARRVQAHVRGRRARRAPAALLLRRYRDICDENKRLHELVCRLVLVGLRE